MRSEICNLRWLHVALLMGLAAAIPVAARAAADDAPSAEVRAKVLAQARTALVQVELYLKHPTGDDADDASGSTNSSDKLDRQQELVARFKKSVHLMGAIVSPREVLVPDTGIDPRRIARWDVIDSTGRRIEARRTALLLDVPAIAIEPVDAAAKWDAPKFADAKLDSAASLTIVTTLRSQVDWVLGVTSVSAESRWTTSKESPDEARPFWSVGTMSLPTTTEDGETPPVGANVIFSAKGELLGAALGDRAYPDRAVPPWRGADLVKAPRVSIEQWNQIEAKTLEKLAPTLYPVRIEYRRLKGGFFQFPDVELLGWAISDRELLLSASMHRELTARINRITIQSRGTELEGKFIGQVKSLDASVIRIPDDAEPLPAHADLNAAGRIAPIRPHVAVLLRRRFGANDLRTDYTRALGYELVVANRLSPMLTPAPTPSSMVLDTDGNPIGFFTRFRRPFEDLDGYEQGLEAALDNPRARRAAVQAAQLTSSIELFPLSFIAEALADPKSAFDPHVVVREEKDQDRRFWLGIEFNPLTRELAESLGCRKESRDGQLGLMISQIYGGSPADRIGLRTGDVLLGFELRDLDRPVQLAPGSGGVFNFSQMMGGDDGGFPGGGRGGQRAPWPSQSNYLTNLLSTIGDGEKIKLRFWRDGKLQNADAVVEMAPPDQDSATQFKDETLGITVKEITFEVRAALNLKPDDPGVVVAKIESGSPAGRARINPFEIVQSADDEPIGSPAKFEAVVKKAIEEKKDQIRLVIVDRGRSRFADLKLGQ